MKKIFLLLMCLLYVSVWAAKPKELNVAYFLEWPSANQIYQMDKTYDKKMGIKVNWRSFDNGNAMTSAMVAGDIDIAYSQGFVPFVVGVSKGAKIKLVGIAMTYAENDNCVVHKDAGITKRNAKKLEGKKVASPTGNVTHYKLLKTLEHLNVDINKVRIVSMANADVSSALARGDVTMACGFGGSLVRMKKYGDVLMTGAEQEAIGLKVFDIVSVATDFADKYPDTVKQFLKLTDDANKLYYKNPKKYYNVLSKASGMKRADTIDTLNKMTFFSSKKQLERDWMGGGVLDFTKQVADFFVEQNQLAKALSKTEYAKSIDSSFLK